MDYPQHLSLSIIQFIPISASLILQGKQRRTDSCIVDCRERRKSHRSQRLYHWGTNPEMPGLVKVCTEGCPWAWKGSKWLSIRWIRTLRNRDDHHILWSAPWALPSWSGISNLPNGETHQQETPYAKWHGGWRNLIQYHHHIINIYIMFFLKFPTSPLTCHFKLLILRDPLPKFRPFNFNIRNLYIYMTEYTLVLHPPFQ